MIPCQSNNYYDELKSNLPLPHCYTIITVIMSSNFGNPVDPRLDPSENAYVPNTHRYETGPGPTTAGPHQSDLANKVDPRVDSDLNNRAQYAPGTTTATNTHPGATTFVDNPASSNLGPHGSNLYNKVDPRVDSKSGEMTSKTTNGQGSGSAKEPVQHGYPNQSQGITTDSNNNYSGAGVVPGASTGAPAAPSAAASNNYNRDVPSRYNNALGTGSNPEQYNTTTSNASNTADRTQQQPTTTMGLGADRMRTGPSGSSTAASGSAGGSTTGGKASGSGGVKGALAGIHVSTEHS
jgi:hypothetical protein